MRFNVLVSTQLVQVETRKCIGHHRSVSWERGRSLGGGYSLLFLHWKSTLWGVFAWQFKLMRYISCVTVMVCSECIAQSFVSINNMVYHNLCIKFWSKIILERFCQTCDIIKFCSYLFLVCYFFLQNRNHISVTAVSYCLLWKYFYKWM